jgi:hypothetical protein
MKIEFQYDNGLTDRDIASLRALAKELIAPDARFRFAEISEGDEDIHEIIARNTEPDTVWPFSEDRIREIAALEPCTSIMFDGDVLEGYGDHLYFELVRTR